MKIIDTRLVKEANMAPVFTGFMDDNQDTAAVADNAAMADGGINNPDLTTARQYASAVEQQKLNNERSMLAMSDKSRSQAERDRRLTEAAQKQRDSYVQAVNGRMFGGAHLARARDPRGFARMRAATHAYAVEQYAQTTYNTFGSGTYDQQAWSRSIPADARGLQEHTVRYGN